MKALLFLLPLFWIPSAFGQSPLPAATVELEAPGPSPEVEARAEVFDLSTGSVSLEGLMGIAAEMMAAPPNVLFKNGADELEVPPLQLRKVSFKGLIEALNVLLDVRAVEIPGESGSRPTVVLVARESEGGGMGNGRAMFGGGGDTPPAVGRGAGAAGDFLGGQPGLVAPRPPGEPMPPVPPPAPFVRELLPAARIGGVETRVFATEDLGLEDEAIEAAVRATWDLSDPGWEQREPSARLLFHPQTRMLIVKSSPMRLAEVEQILAELKRVREQGRGDEVMVLRREMEARQRENQMSMIREREMQERGLEELRRDREQLLDRIRELEIELRKAGGGE